jgi:hypothetical protein
MDDAPKRSVRDTVTQLIVIAILLALIVASVIFLRQYIDSRNTSDGSNVPVSTQADFSFTCCSGFDASAIYHPGEDVRLSWTPLRETTGAIRRDTITLSASLSRSFHSPGAIKSSVKGGKGVNAGPFIAQSSRFVSDRSGASAVVVLRIPGNARTGYYDLITSSTQQGVTQTNASIFEIRR